MSNKVVLIFGDSLSDIGRMDRSALGRFLNTTGLAGELTGTGGRFSSGPNWTDYMIEETSGFSVLGDSRTTTNTTSDPHRSLSTNSYINVPPQGAQSYYYANYAKGGACVSGYGGGFTGRMILDDFAAQVKMFKKDLAKFRTSLPPRDDFDPMKDLDFVIFVWFGANDVYTCNKSTQAVFATADRYKYILDDLCAFLEPYKKRLVMMNLPQPSAAAKNTTVLKNYEKQIKALWSGWNPDTRRPPHQRLVHEKNKLKADFARRFTGGGWFQKSQSKVEYAKFKKLEELWYQLYYINLDQASRCRDFNGRVKDNFGAYPNLLLIDVSSVFSQENVDQVASIWGMVSLGETDLATVPKMMAPRAGWIDSTRNVQSIQASQISIMSPAEEVRKVVMTSSDRSHPSAETYEIMWSVIKNHMMLDEKHMSISFGRLEPIIREMTI